MTVEDAIEKLRQAHFSIKYLWEDWAPRKRNEDYLNLGHVLIFLVKHHHEIVNHGLVSEKQYHKLVESFSKEAPQYVMTRTPDVDHSLPPSNPLRAAMTHADHKTVEIVLKHTPEEALNQLPLGAKERDMNYPLYLAVVHKMKDSIVNEIFTKTNNREALEEAWLALPRTVKSKILKDRIKSKLARLEEEATLQDTSMFNRVRTGSVVSQDSGAFSADSGSPRPSPTREFRAVKSPIGGPESAC